MPPGSEVHTLDINYLVLTHDFYICLLLHSFLQTDLFKNHFYRSRFCGSSLSKAPSSVLLSFLAFAYWVIIIVIVPVIVSTLMTFRFTSLFLTFTSLPCLRRVSSWTQRLIYKPEYPDIYMHTHILDLVCMCVLYLSIYNFSTSSLHPCWQFHYCPGQLSP